MRIFFVINGDLVISRLVPF